MTDGRVAHLLSVLAAHPGGIEARGLLAELREVWPNLTEAQAMGIVRSAGDAVRMEEARVFPNVGAPQQPAALVREGTRVISFDCETALRLITAAPYTDARIFQLAAVRSGTDASWVAAAEPFNRFVELPEGFEVYNTATKERYEEYKANPVTVLENFRTYVADADFLVAYNGEVADFEFIDRACDLANIERVEGPARCDGYYLSLCLFPLGSQPHSLVPLATHAGIDVSGLTWHDALDDSVVLACLVDHMAHMLAALPERVRTIIGALCADSAPWRMLFELAALGVPQATALDDAGIARVFETELGRQTPVRRRGRSTVGAIPGKVKGPGGTVDPHLVAVAARGQAEVRQAQHDMSQVIRGWVHDGTDGLCEAPTGIGKSYVTIATALEWLETHSSGRVVIATHTKQLQRQLASELESLATGDLAWLRGAAGLVKGAQNRLSLRALVGAISDCSGEVANPTNRTRPVLWSELRFRELLVYLCLRLIAPTVNLNDEWEARSVDQMDVPAFFESYTEKRLARWLHLLSQSESGDYHLPPATPLTPSGGATPGAPAPGATPTPGPDPGTPSPGAPSPKKKTHEPLHTHTELVREAVERHRLVITNHALLMAHLDDVADPETLLIVDEAHAIEGAATDALSESLDYVAFETLTLDIRRFAREAAAAFDTRPLDGAANDLEAALRAEILPRTVQRVFDRVLGPSPGGPLANVSNRAATMASWWGGDQARGEVIRALGEVRRLARTVSFVTRTLRAIGGSGALAGLGRDETQRFWSLRDKAETLSGACAAVLDVADSIFGRPPPPGGQQGGGAQPGPGGRPTPRGQPVPSGQPGSAARQPGPPGPVSNGASAVPMPSAGTPGPLTDPVAGSVVTDGADAGGDEEGEDEELKSVDDADIVDPDTVAEGLAPPGGSASAGIGSPAGGGSSGSGNGTGAGGVRAGVPPPAVPAVPPPNRIVWAAEQPSPELARGARWYNFTLNATPIELSAEGEWQRLRPAFARSIWISATLSVAGRFDFIRSRLGFGADVAEHRLPASFNYRDHARLYVLSDFPSWAEHETQAIRTTAWQVSGFCAEVSRPDTRPEGADPAAPTPLRGGAMVITTSTSAASGIADRLSADLSGRGARVPVHAAVLRGNARALSEFEERGGALVGTKGLWAGVDVSSPERLRMLWVNKLPFAPFADPLIEARRAVVAARAADAGAEDPDAVAQRDYYLPLAAMELRQGIGRLIRSDDHRGVIVISDRRLAGGDKLRQMYRDIFLGSLDDGLLVADGQDRFGGNVTTMAQAWTGIWDFMASLGELGQRRAAELSTPEELSIQTISPEMRRIKELCFTDDEVKALRVEGVDVFAEAVRARCTEVARNLDGKDETFELRPAQVEVIDQVARGEDCLALLPTGFGKSYCFQLPALVLPGVTVVISPLVALMTDQAMALNRTIGGAVRALVSPLRDSSSRAGKAEVTAALRGEGDGEIKLVYISPERVAQRAFREALFEGVRTGRLARIAVDEAHTLVQWGDDFRPAFRRLEPVLDELRRRAADAGHDLSITALTATANRSVRDGLLDGIFGGAAVPVIEANPIRPELAIYSRELVTRGGDVAISGIAESVVDRAPGHVIIYCLTVNEVQTTYAQLREWIGPERASQVRRFHGRLSEAEKASVLNDFKSVPRFGHEGYYKMIVVCTSAFGLGVDRPDVSAVLCLSPPSDLAALYQQLGRAGRGLAQGANGHGIGAAGMALAHRRGWRMVEFLTTTDLDTSVLCDLGSRVLAAGGLVDPREIAADAIAAAVASGSMNVDVAQLARTRDDYRVGVVRAIALLANLGALRDHGDIPARVKVTAGTFTPEEYDDRAFVDAVIGGVSAVATPGARGIDAVTVDTDALHDAVSRAGVTEPGDGPAETWVRLLDAHGAGWLDVSQFALDQRYLSALEILEHTLPPAFTQRIGGRRNRAMREITEMRRWFATQNACAQKGFADYFSSGLPPDTCSTALCRCSRCWFDPVGAGDPDPQPALFDAFMRYNPRPMTNAEDARRTARLATEIKAILRLKYRGVTTVQLEALFTGKDSVWNSRRGRSYRVPGWIPDHALFGSGRGWLKRRKLETVLNQLQALGDLGLDGRYWRLAANITAGQAAPTAAPKTAPVPPPTLTAQGAS